MMKINGSLVEAANYEFGVRESPVRIDTYKDYREARARATESGKELVMRVVYLTVWESAA